MRKDLDEMYRLGLYGNGIERIKLKKAVQIIQKASASQVKIVDIGHDNFDSACEALELGSVDMAVVDMAQLIRMEKNDENLPYGVVISGAMGGEAVADILFGNVSPSGRLPVTFYESIDDLPPFEDYSMENRTYKFFKGKPVYEFGYGLTYSNITENWIDDKTVEIENKGYIDTAYSVLRYEYSESVCFCDINSAYERSICL